jgi:hypothetical protein
MSTWQRWAWLVWAASAVHNVEEAATVPGFVRRDGGWPFDYWDPTGFIIGVTILTLIGTVLIIVATTGRPRRWKPYLPSALAAVMLINVVIPHVPAAIAYGGYAPGVISAVALNLPIDTAFLVGMFRHGHLHPWGRRPTPPSGPPD